MGNDIRMWDREGRMLLQFVAVCCISFCCSVLQCVAVCCSVFSEWELISECGTVKVGCCCSLLQCVAFHFVAVCCSVSQCVAACLVSGK